MKFRATSGRITHGGEDRAAEAQRVDQHAAAEAEGVAPQEADAAERASGDPKTALEGAAPAPRCRPRYRTVEDDCRQQDPQGQEHRRVIGSASFLPLQSIARGRRRIGPHGAAWECAWTSSRSFGGGLARAAQGNPVVDLGDGVVGKRASSSFLGFSSMPFRWSSSHSSGVKLYFAKTSARRARRRARTAPRRRLTVGWLTPRLSATARPLWPSRTRCR